MSNYMTISKNNFFRLNLDYTDENEELEEINSFQNESSKEGLSVYKEVSNRKSKKQIKFIKRAKSLESKRQLKLDNFIKKREEEELKINTNKSTFNVAAKDKFILDTPYLGLQDSYFKDSNKDLERSNIIDYKTKNSSTFSKQENRDSLVLNEIENEQFNIILLRNSVILHDNEKIKKIIDGGFNINFILDENFNTALHLALKTGNNNTINFLLENGASTNKQNRFGETPLHFICKYTLNHKLLKLLLLYQADPLITTYESKNCLDYCLERNFTKGYEILENYLKANNISHNISNKSMSIKIYSPELNSSFIYHGNIPHLNLNNTPNNYSYQSNYQIYSPYYQNMPHNLNTTNTIGTQNLINLSNINNLVNFHNTGNNYQEINNLNQHYKDLSPIRTESLNMISKASNYSLQLTPNKTNSNISHQIKNVQINNFQQDILPTSKNNNNFLLNSSAEFHKPSKESDNDSNTKIEIISDSNNNYDQDKFRITMNTIYETNSNACSQTLINRKSENKLSLSFRERQSRLRFKNLIDKNQVIFSLDVEKNDTLEYFDPYKNLKDYSLNERKYFSNPDVVHDNNLEDDHLANVIQKKNVSKNGKIYLQSYDEHMKFNTEKLLIQKSINEENDNDEIISTKLKLSNLLTNKEEKIIYYPADINKSSTFESVKIQQSQASQRENANSKILGVHQPIKNIIANKLENIINKEYNSSISLSPKKNNPDPAPLNLNNFIKSKPETTSFVNNLNMSEVNYPFKDQYENNLFSSKSNALNFSNLSITNKKSSNRSILSINNGFINEINQNKRKEKTSNISNSPFVNLTNVNNNINYYISQQSNQNYKTSSNYNQENNSNNQNTIIKTSNSTSHGQHDTFMLNSNKYSNLNSDEYTKIISEAKKNATSEIIRQNNLDLKRLNQQQHLIQNLQIQKKLKNSKEFYIETDKTKIDGEFSKTQRKTSIGSYETAQKESYSNFKISDTGENNTKNYIPSIAINETIEKLNLTTKPSDTRYYKSSNKSGIRLTKGNINIDSPKNSNKTKFTSYLFSKNENINKMNYPPKNYEKPIKIKTLAITPLAINCYVKYSNKNKNKKEIKFKQEQQSDIIYYDNTSQLASDIRKVVIPKSSLMNTYIKNKSTNEKGSMSKRKKLVSSFSEQKSSEESKEINLKKYVYIKKPKDKSFNYNKNDSLKSSFLHEEQSIRKLRESITHREKSLNLVLSYLLKKSNLSKYESMLIENGFDDIEFLINENERAHCNCYNKQSCECRKKEKTIEILLKEIGMTKCGDRIKFLLLLQSDLKIKDLVLNDFIEDNLNIKYSYFLDESKVESILKTIFESENSINEETLTDPCFQSIYSMFHWFEDLKLYDEFFDFIEQKYYSKELLYLQMNSYYPLDEERLKEIGVGKLGHRQKILRKLYSDSEDFLKKNINFDSIISIERRGLVIGNEKSPKKEHDYKIIKRLNFDSINKKNRAVSVNVEKAPKKEEGSCFIF